MSKESFIGGDYIERTGGSVNIYSQGNIENYSATNFLQKGDESGVSYGKADKLHDNNRPINDIRVTLNLFFDGTQNNKTNSILGENSPFSNHDDDSYTNDFSNIAKGYDAIDSNAKNQVSVYIEGIGTVDGKRDTLQWLKSIPNNLGSPTGEGERGIEAKVTRGCIKAAERLKKIYENKEISFLQVNVFGFSRGAAAARHFVHLCHRPADTKEVKGQIKVSPPKKFEQPDGEKEAETTFYLNKIHKDFINKYGYFGACLVNSNVNVQKIYFNFAGLYDTVASYGLNHKGISFSGVTILKNDSKQLHLDAIKKCNTVIHMITQEEFRENFALTNIKKSGINGIELTLPGVHSDIGGGYKNNTHEKVLIYKGSRVVRKIVGVAIIIMVREWGIFS